jgi:hypothetical protein
MENSLSSISRLSPDATEISERLPDLRCGSVHPDAFENALDNAQCAGEIDLGVDTIAQARFLTSAVLGIAVLVRAKAPSAIVEGAAEVALAHVASLVPA